MYKRLYLDILLKLKDDELIKIVSGIRRCGKSILLKQLAEELPDALYIDLEDYRNLHLRNGSELHEYVLNQQQKYILIDEIQFVDDFEDVVNSLRKHKSLYITGSNSFMLSSNMSTKLSGRYVSIVTYPFSFLEMEDFRNTSFDQYLLQGGMPTVSFEEDAEIRKLKLTSLIETIVINDILSYKCKVDPTLLKIILYYIVENIGSEISIRNITNTLKSKGVDTTHYKTTEIIDSLVESGTIYAINKYKIRGKERLVQNKKYYIADTAFTEMLDFQNYGANLENIVFTHLKREGFEIFFGDNEGQEVDFVAIRNDNIYYIQVSLSILDSNTYKREVTSLDGIIGRKILITKDNEKSQIRDDIEYYDIKQFLSNFKYHN